MLPVHPFQPDCRTEVLDCHVFESLREVRSMTVGWLHRYKHHRPHESPGRIPPAGYRVKRFPGLGFWVVQENEETSLTYRGAALIAVFRVVHSSLVTGTMSCLKYHQK
ncbi:integrase core domain-containing protein [Comamonas thiooxydans]|uniref:integrase core domain-containing protein n=1 Tax=Comamonas thiooxydans TaxID=363952 RepID=UPI00351A99FD